MHPQQKIEPPSPPGEDNGEKEEEADVQILSFGWSHKYFWVKIDQDAGPIQVSFQVQVGLKMGVLLGQKQSKCIFSIFLCKINTF